MTATLPAPPVRTYLQPSRAVDMLVVGGSVVAPLNLLIVRSLTVFDVLIACAFMLLLRERALVPVPWRYVALAYVFLLMALVSSFRATYPGEALTQVLQYAFIFFIQVPVVLTVVRTRRHLVASVALLCVGTLGAMAHAHLTQVTQGAGRVLVFYSDNPNRLGYPAVYLLPLLVVLWHVARRAAARRRLVTAVAIGGGLYLSVWALTASGSRSALAGSAVAVLVHVAIRPGLGALRIFGRLVLAGLVTTVLAVGLVSTGQLPDTLVDRVTRSVQPENTEDATGLLADREHLVNAGVRAFVDSPLLGTGLDNFRYVATDHDTEARPQLPHNLLLQLLVQVGLVGTVAFYAYLGVWARDLTRAFRRLDPPDTELAWGLVASVAGILAVFFFAPEMLDRHYWLIVALGLAVALRSQPAPQEDPHVR